MNRPLLLFSVLCPAWLAAHTGSTGGVPFDQEALRQHILDDFMARRTAPPPRTEVKKTQVAATASGFSLAPLLQLNAHTASGPAGNGALLAAS